MFQNRQFIDTKLNKEFQGMLLKILKIFGKEAIKKVEISRFLQINDFTSISNENFETRFAKRCSIADKLSTFGFLTWEGISKRQFSLKLEKSEIYKGKGTKRN